MVDQAQKLREFVKRNQQRARVLAVTSGKGGVGKTSTSVNLAITLAQRGARVVLLDADLGLANVEVLLGLNSLYNLQHVIDGEKKITDILVTGPAGILVVPGSSGLAKFADLDAAARQRVLDGLEALQGRSDYIIIDTMAGIGRNASSFAAAADEVLLVTTPEPSAIVDAYAMLKTVNSMREDAVFRVIVNMVANQEQANAVAAKLASVCRQFLGRNLSSLGYIPRDNHVSQGVMQTTPFSLRYPQAPATRSIQDIATRIMHQRVAPQGEASFLKRVAQHLGLASSA